VKNVVSKRLLFSNGSTLCAATPRAPISFLLPPPPDVKAAEVTWTTVALAVGVAGGAAALLCVGSAALGSLARTVQRSAAKAAQAGHGGPGSPGGGNPGGGGGGEGQGREIRGRFAFVGPISGGLARLSGLTWLQEGRGRQQPQRLGGGGAAAAGDLRVVKSQAASGGAGGAARFAAYLSPPARGGIGKSGARFTSLDDMDPLEEDPHREEGGGRGRGRGRRARGDGKSKVLSKRNQQRSQQMSPSSPSSWTGGDSHYGDDYYDVERSHYDEYDEYGDPYYGDRNGRGGGPNSHGRGGHHGRRPPDTGRGLKSRLHLPPDTPLRLPSANRGGALYVESS
jgi:hypothetical protein